ncbi:MAG: chemotaxis-specific protein-glutamate methyltransferase CheB [Rhodospirillaceae bacterium]|nr:chemotaxis-specific protein-glutamate methyltransferase CheB [Rhodospirillaceae bacterium]
MVVEDAAVVRGMLIAMLESDPMLRVVSAVGDGAAAVQAIARQTIDVVVLDIEMPVMDGLTAMPLLMRASPGTRIIVTSALTARNAAISLRAMVMGAADYVSKPNAGRGLHAADAYRSELVAKVKALAAGVREQAAGPTGWLGRAAAPAASPAYPTRPVPRGFRPEVVAIGSSTGGPQALFQVIGGLAGRVGLPILVTQHMPAAFTRVLAQQMSRQCAVDAVEPGDGDKVHPGKVHVAPGGVHMVVERGGDGRPTIRLSQAPPENFCRPSVDVMLRSLAATYGAHVLAVILTGMGTDGLKGCEQTVAAGGTVLAQNQATSVVWGMPGAVSTAGLSSDILPLEEIAPAIHRLVLNKAA